MDDDAGNQGNKPGSGASHSPKRAAASGFFCIDVLSKDVTFSATAQRLLGYRSNDQIHFRDVLKKFEKEDHQQLSELLSKVIQGGESQSIRINLTSPRVQSPLILTADVLERDAGGQVTKIAGVIALEPRATNNGPKDLGLIQLNQQITQQLLSSENSVSLDFGAQIDADYLCCYKLLNSAFVPIHEWHRPDAESGCNELTSPLKSDQPFFDRLRREPSFYLSFERSGSSETERELVNRYKYPLILICPLKQDGLPNGFLLYGASACRQFNESTLPNLLQTAADLLSSKLNSLESKRAALSNLKRLDEAFKVCGMSSWVMNLKDHTCTLSDSFEYLFGHLLKGDRKDTLNVISCIVDEHYLPQARASFRDAQKTGKTYINFEFPTQSRDGDVRWFMNQCVFKDIDEKGHPRYCIIIVTDITASKVTKSELLNSQINERAANGIKNEFLARMSHEIRTPINAIIGMSELLNSSELSEEQADKIRVIEKSSAALLDIVDDILDFSSITTGNHVLHNSNFDSDKLFNQLSEEYKTAADIKGLDLDFDISSDIPKFLLGDADRLYQVLSNLLENAFKFTQAGRIILKVTPLSLSKSRIVIRFTVSDTGIGIEAGNLENLFQPFHQLEQFSTRKHQGSGLGLALCQSIVKDMHGTISAHSKPGEGSTFTCDIPLSQSPVGSKDLRYHAVNYQNIKLLVLDYDQHSLEVTKNIIRSMNIDANFTGSAEEAISLLKRHSHSQFDLLLLSESHREPLDGFIKDLASPLNRLPRRPRTMLLSHRNQSKLKAMDALIRIDETISKPFTPSKLFDGLLNIFGESLLDNLNQKPTAIEAKDIEQLRGKQVLLAEDNIVNQKVAVGILERKGIDVTIAENGRKAIDALNNHASGFFSAILMDIDMPEMNGHEATELIRAGSRDHLIPIIAMTAHALEGDRERCLASGMNDYVMKPVKPEKLYNTLAWHILHTNKTE